MTKAFFLPWKCYSSPLNGIMAIKKPRKTTKLHIKINFIQEIYWEGKVGVGGMPDSAWKRGSKEMKRQALYRVSLGVGKGTELAREW